MAYQNVGTPRFFVDTALYQKAIGVYSGSWDSDYGALLNLNPTNVINVYPANIQIPRLTPITYMAVLGHNGRNKMMYPEFWFLAEDDTSGQNTPNTEIINAQAYDQAARIDRDGFSIWKLTDNENADAIRLMSNDSNLSMGAVSVGNYYEMPHSPDLNLKLSYEYDGVKTIQTKGGATLSNSSYYKPADWGGLGAWQLGGAATLRNYRSGRRVWDLSFSYLSDSDIMPIVAATTNYHAGDYENTSNVHDNTLLDGTDFFSQVWNRTIGGHLQFIFQPDYNNNNPDQFALCRFDMDSLTYDQVANNVYNVKLKIRESW